MAPSQSLIIPVYKNAETIAPLLAALERLHTELGGDLEVVFVVDGSPDASSELLAQGLAEGNLTAQLILLSRNFGSFAAIRMGLEAARGQFLAVMAADLQEPPELISAFFAALRADEADIVIGRREGRDDPWRDRMMSELFWRVYRTLVQPDIPEGGVDVFGCNRKVRDTLLQLGESNSSLVGLLFWIGFRRAYIPYRRRQRVAGKSSWSLRKKVRYLLDSTFAFTNLPLTLIIMVGALGFIGSILVSLLVLIAWLTGNLVPGYAPIMLAISTSTALILFSMGVVGTYVWRTFENTKKRPLYIPMSHEYFGGSRSPVSDERPTNSHLRPAASGTRDLTETRRLPG
jgi:glycosyltransferase involved in cell wall biosynthesis